MMLNQATTEIALITTVIALAITSAVKKNAPDMTAGILASNNVLGLRGIACVTVICHHAAQIYAIDIFYFAGMTCVSLFLFLSGYGLYEAYSANPEKYVRDFPRKRFLYTLGTYLAIDMAFWIVTYILTPGQPFMLDTWRMMLSGNLRDASIIYAAWRPSEWFANAILFLYVITYIGMLFAHKNRKIICLAATVGAAIWAIIWVQYDLEHMLAYRYASIHLFPAGTLFAAYKDRIFDIAKRHFRLIVIATGIAGLIAATNWYEAPIYQSILSIVTTILILAVLTRVSFQNKLVNYIGVISFEAYLVQSVFVRGYPGFGSPAARLPCSGILCVLFSLALGAFWHVVLKPFRVTICKRKE